MMMTPTSMRGRLRVRWRPRPRPTLASRRTFQLASVALMILSYGNHDKPSGNLSDVVGIAFVAAFPLSSSTRIHSQSRSAFVSTRETQPALFMHNDEHDHAHAHEDEDENHHRQQQQQPQQQQPEEDTNLRPSKRRHEQWLAETTASLIDLTDEELNTNGKHHQLISMFSAWEKMKRFNPKSPLQMERILQRLIRVGQPVTITLYNQLLDTWACAAHFRTHDPMAASQRAREILVMLQQTYEQQRQHLAQTEYDESAQDARCDKSFILQPNAKSFDCVFHVVNKVEGIAMARRVLHWMEYLDRVDRNDHAKPKLKHYILLLNGIAKGKHNTGKSAEGLLRHMEVFGVQPDTLCYNLAIKAWTKNSGSSNNIGRQSGRQAAEQVDMILDTMAAPKDIITYSSAISAWATSGMQAHAVSRVEEILRRIEQDPNVQPNTIVLNSVMSAWVKSKNPGAIQRTEELLLHMVQNEQNAPSQRKRHQRHQNSQQQHNHHHQHQHQQQHKSRQQSNPRKQPRRNGYRSDKSSQDHETLAVPDLISYNTHLHALNLHAHTIPDAAERAHRILRAMEQRHTKERTLRFGPNRFSYNLVIDAYAKQSSWKAVQVLRDLIRHDTLQPDTSSFNHAFSALSTSMQPGSAQLAEQLLEYMENAYEGGVHPKARPDPLTYISIITAWKNSDDENAAEQAHAMLQRMKAPSRNAYNCVIECWSNGRGTYGARQAEALLQDMEESGISPNSSTYNAILKCWANSGTLCCGNKAEIYLDRMWELYRSGQNHIRPNVITYNTVIKAISQSKSEAKPQKALRLLRRMDKLYQGGYKEARPDQATFTSVLRSCAFPPDQDKRIRRKALDTAMFTMEELRSSRYGAPTHITYGTFLKTARSLLDDDETTRRHVIRKTFQQACKDGQVGEMMLAQLGDAAPEDLYQELLAEVDADVGIEKGAVKVEDLPWAWRKNLRTHTKEADVFATRRRARGEN